MLVSIFADASWAPTERVCGWGSWCKSERGSQMTGGIVREHVDSSQTAELMAAYNGILIAVSSGVAQASDHLLVQSDNTRVVQVLRLQYIPNIHPVELKIKNKLMGFLDRHQLTLSSRHVKGHTNSKEHVRYWVHNECDRVAGEHMRVIRSAVARGRTPWGFCRENPHLALYVEWTGISPINQDEPRVAVASS